jgi:hypothetical protein
LIVPPRPRSEPDSTSTRAIGTATATSPKAVPSRSRARARGAWCATRKPIARPAPSASRTVAITNRPNSVATASRTASGWSFSVNASWRSAHTITGAAAASEKPSTVMLRSRSGTNAIHSRAPTPATTIAARE